MENSTRGLDKTTESVRRTMPLRLRPYSEAAVQAACEGREHNLSPAERCEAINRLTKRGIAAAKIASILQCSERTVRRTRTFIREQAA